MRTHSQCSDSVVQCTHSFKCVVHTAVCAMCIGWGSDLRCNDLLFQFRTEFYFYQFSSKTYGKHNVFFLPYVNLLLKYVKFVTFLKYVRNNYALVGF